MRKIYKITVFLIIMTIALNINIGLYNKHFLQLRIGEVEAEEPLYYFRKYTIGLYQLNNFGLVSSQYEHYPDGYTSYKLDPFTGQLSSAGAHGYIPAYYTLYSPYGSNLYKYIYNYDKDKTDTYLASIVYNPDVPGKYIETITAPGNRYPLNGKNKDGYWYIRGDIINNTPNITQTQPTLNSPLNEAGTFTMSGTVTDPDEDTLTISATIGGIAKSTTVAGPATNNTWSLSWTGAELPEGQYSNIDVSVSDGKGGTDTKSYTYTIVVDKTKPNSPTISANTAWTKAASVPITITNGTDTGGSGVERSEYSLGGATSKGWTTYSTGFNIINAGQTTISARTIDKAGNISGTKTAEVKIDRTAPTLTLTPSTTAWTNQNVTITAIGSDTGGSGVKEIVKPDSTIAADSITKYEVSENGTYTFKVGDNAGNEINESITINNIDKIPPLIENLIHSNPGVIVRGTDNVTITATFNESMKATPKISLSNIGITNVNMAMGANNKIWTYSWDVPADYDGDSIVTISGTDLAGNAYAGTNKITFIVDNTAPVLNKNAVTELTTDGFKITPNIKDINELHVETPYFYSWRHKETDPWIDGEWTADTFFEITSLLPNEQYQIRYKARDIVGNVSDWLEEVKKYTLANIPEIELNDATQNTIDGIIKFLP